jgi:hypothetical protein
VDDQVRENHLLRLIDRHVSFDFVRTILKKCKPNVREGVATTILYDSRKSIMTGADRNQLDLNPT